MKQQFGNVRLQDEGGSNYSVVTSNYVDLF